MACLSLRHSSHLCVGTARTLGRATAAMACPGVWFKTSTSQPQFRQLHRQSNTKYCHLGRVTGRRVPPSASSKVFSETSTTMSATGSDKLIFRQLFDAQFGSSTYTYILADASTKEAVLIDPVVDLVDRDLTFIDELGLKLIYAINTHCHADHITGTGEIKKRNPSVKSGISKASGAKADFVFEAGDTVTVGSLKLKVLPTPGHTDGCVSFYTTAGGGMVFTGDALLVRGCGRTDFQNGSPETLYKSVHEQLFTLPDETKVFPCHDYKGRTCSTIGEEKHHNPRLSKSADEFVDIMKNLNLSYPKKIDEALPANLACGIQD